MDAESAAVAEVLGAMREGMRCEEPGVMSGSFLSVYACEVVCLPQCLGVEPS